MQLEAKFTEGKIFGQLVRFALPVLAALCLQAMYGAVDLLIVGQFSTAANVTFSFRVMFSISNVCWRESWANPGRSVLR